MFVRSPYNYDGDVVSHQTGLECPEDSSRTQQHFRDECDINVLVARFARTGVPEAPPAPPMSVFDDVFDYQSAMQTIIDARASFAGLPSKLRARFQNDPAQFLNFVYDSSNRDEAISLGLVPPPAPAPVVSSQPSNDDAPSSS